MTVAAIPCFVYASKSSADPNDSVTNQQRRAVERIEREDGRRLGAEPFGEESATGWRGDRGPALTAAMSAAVAAVEEHGSAELWVFHSSRLGRGSGRKAEARSVLEVFTYLRRHGVTLRSVEDDAYVTDEAFIGMASKMANKFVEDLSAFTKVGLQSRKDRGQPVGPVVDGYHPVPRLEDGQVVVDKRGRVVTQRVIDPEREPVIMRIMDGIEAGHTPGEVAASLNRDGLRTDRGARWTAKAVARKAQHPAHSGGGNYPAMVTPERHERVIAALTRTDPVARQARMGGRPRSREYLLAGIGFCTCGAALYTRRPRKTRTYVCGARRQGGSACAARPIPAELVERAVVEHLAGFLDDVEGWLAERNREADTERERFAEALDEQRASLRKLRVRAERAHAQHERLLDTDDPDADGAMRLALKMDREGDELEASIAQGETHLEQMPGPEPVDAALDFYAQLSDAVAGSLDDARTITETNVALRGVLRSALLRYDGERITGVFVLRHATGQLRGALMHGEKMQFYAPAQGPDGPKWGEVVPEAIPGRTPS